MAAVFVTLDKRAPVLHDQGFHLPLSNVSYKETCTTRIDATKNGEDTFIHYV